MIDLVSENSGVSARALCQNKEAFGWEVVSVSESGGKYLITLRKRDEPALLGSHLQKGLQLAVAMLLLDRRGTADRMSSLLALAEGRESAHDMDVIESALARLGK